MVKLLAKSGNDAPALAEHTWHVMDAAEALLGIHSSQTRLGDRWMSFFKLPSETWPVFHTNLIVACALHDWGKANDRMQDVLARKPSAAQAIRHEHFSALMLAQPTCWEWLGKRPGLDREVVLSAVLTHHLKAAFDPNKLYGFATAENGAKGFRSFHRSEAFRQMVLETAERLHLPALDLDSIDDRWAFEGPGVSVRHERDRIKDHLLQPFRRDIAGNQPRRRLLHAVRASLIAADAAGSGLIRSRKPVVAWIEKTFARTDVWDDRNVWESVINRRIADLNQRFAEKGLSPFQWTDFQDDCADSKKVPVLALLLAPCGSGKTLAAWRWIAARLAERPAGHVLFLYPTRATATEGFRDYVSWAPEAEAALMHGTSEFDLAGMFDNGDDPRHENKFEAERKLFALGYWGRRAFSATVDQFLAFLQYGYGSVCMLPVLADSIVVIDEVHSFDRNMFAALKKFLTEFEVPVLCMTATLPTNRQEELAKECQLTVYDDRPGGLKTIADAPRYRFLRVGSRVEAEQAVNDALLANKRVLWVVNQVKRAHTVVVLFAKELPNNPDATDLRTPNGVPVHCYHSRFRLADRVDRHKALMKALKDEPGPALGVTTQVCEMSLDIDVDLLVTEDCPVTALVQRMGRCNRSQNPRSVEVAGAVLVYQAAEVAPYTKGALTGLKEFLDLVDGRKLSQSDLEAAMQQVPSPPTLGDPLCSFLESGPYAVGGEEDFRDSEEFNRPCVLVADVGDYLNAGPDRQPGYLLPVPKKFSSDRDPDNSEHTRLPGYVGVARDGQYHVAVGFCDRKLEEWGAE